MQQQSNNQLRHLLDPYRSIGSFVSTSVSINRSPALVFAVPTLSSYKIYSEDLQIKVVSPCFPQQVVSVATYNQITWVRSGDYLYKMKFHHCIRKWKILNQIQQSSVERQKIQAKCQSFLSNSIMLQFEGIIILAEGNKIYVICEKSSTQQENDQQISAIKVNHKISGMIHPVTYVNKVVVYQRNSASFSLVNPMSEKILYEFPRISDQIQQRNSTIINIQSSNLVDIVAISLSNGQILIVNLKKDQIVFQMKQKSPAYSLAFSALQPLMASGDQNGHVIIWDLENKKILYKMQSVFENGTITNLFFSDSFPLLTCFSASTNSIKQLKINKNDNKILTLFRQRVGLKDSLTNCKILSNHDVILQSEKETMFMSIYSHSNNYLLPKCLDSRLGIHIRRHHFSIEVYKGNSLESNQGLLKSSFNIHQEPIIGKISVTGRYFIVASKTKAYRLGQGNAAEIKWLISGIRQIVLYDQHSIFFFTEKDLHIVDFNTDTILKSIQNIGQCKNIAVNHYGNFIAFENRTHKRIQIWDMSKMTKGRQLSDQQLGNQVSCICFTGDNKFLIAAYKDRRLVIWNVLNSQIYKSYSLQKELLWLGLTPDNQFMLSIDRNSKQAKIWNNYIGKIPTSNQKNTFIKFATQIHQVLGENQSQQYRKKLNNTQLVKRQNIESVQIRKQFELASIQDQFLSQVQDSQDGLHQYSFKNISQISPLLYYDQIRQRNTQDFAKSQVALPFFMDFRNVTQEKQKLQKQIQEEAKEKKKQHQKKRDKLLENQSHQIQLNQDSTPQQFFRTFNMLKSLSIAEIDYQIRKFLLNPTNSEYLCRMFLNVFDDAQDREYKNIIFARSIEILGSAVFEQNISQILMEIYRKHESWFSEQQKLVYRVSIIAGNSDKN